MLSRNLVAIALLAPVVLTSCGSKEDANKKNFGRAISEHLKKHGELCLNGSRWPVDIPVSKVSGNQPPQSEAARLASLEKVKLVTAERVEKDNVGLFGSSLGKVEVMRYTLSDKAKEFTREAGPDMFSGAGAQKLCWGQQALDEVVKWEGPMVYGDYKEALVKYHYKVDSKAKWADDTSIQESFPEIKRTIEGAKNTEKVIALKLTSEGWEAKQGLF